MKNPEQTKDFLFTLCPQGKWKVEFNDLTSCYRFDKLDNLQKDIYFLSAVSDPTSRNSDADIVFKNYFVLDVDIRKEHYELTWEVMDDLTLMQKWLEVKELLNNSGYSDWRYMIASGNWFHFYFVGIWRDYSWEDYKKYKSFVQYHYKYLWEILAKVWVKVDNSCANIAKIFRLPWTKNYKRKTYWLKPVECEIIEEQWWLISDKFDLFDKVVEEQEQNKFVKNTEYKIKHSMKWIDDPVLDAILHLNIFDIIYDITGIEGKRDGRNLKSPKDDSRIWAFVEKNVLYITWTHHFKDDCAWYNPFTFVKVHKWLDNAQTFQWFKDNYKEIDSLSKEAMQEFKKEKQADYSDRVVVDNYKNYFMSYDELLQRSKEFRRSISLEWVCKYGVKWIDDYIGWILPDELVVIGARSWVGKSEIAYNISTMNAERWKKVMLFTLEGNIEEPALRHLQRMISHTEDIKPVEYRFNTRNVDWLEDQAQMMIPRAIKENLMVFKKEDIPNLSLLKQLIMQWQKDVDLIVIDHLNYIELNSDNENKEIGEIMRELKKITDIIKKPVVLISHVRKPSSKEIDSDPTMFDLYGSSNVAKEATTIIMISKSKLWLTKTMDEDTHRHRYSWTRFCVAKSRALGNKELIIHWAYDFRRKEYVDEEWCLDEDSWVKDDEKIFKV